MHCALAAAENKAAEKKIEAGKTAAAAPAAGISGTPLHTLVYKNKHNYTHEHTQ
jgi:hypothetical protein